jgi:hypothetical protein
MEETECNSTGIKQKIISTLLFGKQLLLNPAKTFRNMPREGGFSEPLITLATIGFISGILKVFVNFCFMANGARIGLFTALSALIIMPIIVIGLGYLGAFLLSMLMRLVGSEDNLELALRVTAYLAIISPVAVVILPIPYAGNLVLFAILAYLLVAAGIEVYQLNSNTAWLLFGLGVGLLALLSLGSEITTRLPAPTKQTVTICPAALANNPATHHKSCQ